MIIKIPNMVLRLEEPDNNSDCPYRFRWLFNNMRIDMNYGGEIYYYIMMPFTFNGIRQENDYPMTVMKRLGNFYETVNMPPFSDKIVFKEKPVTSMMLD